MLRGTHWHQYHCATGGKAKPNVRHSTRHCWPQFTISKAALHQTVRNCWHTVPWKFWSWSLATGLRTTSIIHPPTRGIQSVQTQQITAAAGKYGLKKTRRQLPTACPDNCDSTTECTDALRTEQVSLCFIVAVQILRSAAGISSSSNHMENRGGNGATRSFDNLKTRNYCAVVAAAQNKRRHFWWRQKAQGSRVQAEKKPEDDQSQRPALVTIEKFRAGEGVSFWVTPQH